MALIMSSESKIERDLVIYEPGETILVARISRDGKHTRHSGQLVSDVLSEYPRAKVMSFDEASKLIDIAMEEKYVTAFSEITNEQYQDSFECLPPEMWMHNKRFEHNGEKYLVEGFRMIEYTAGSIVNHFYRVKKENSDVKCFSAGKVAHTKLHCYDYDEMYWGNAIANEAMSIYVPELLEQMSA
mgnify:FL=1|jgi:hypothetical protein